MIKNMGTLDRIIRTLAAVAVAVLYFTDVIGGWLAIVLGIAAIIWLATSLVGHCPAYLPFKLKTMKKEPAQDQQTADSHSNAAS